MAIDIRVYSDEVTARMDQLPKRLQTAIRRKMENIFSHLESEILNSKQGKYLDPKTISHEVTTLGTKGGLIIGSFEYSDKTGVYSILPVNKPMLVNIKKQFFAKEVHAHPYPKARPMVERILEQKRGYIIEQLRHAAKEI